MTKHIAYYRVSTARQGRSGLGLDAQRAAVASYQPVAEFTEIESGKKNDRPELVAALAQCKAEGATLVIAKLDRLARNARFLLGLIESGVGVIFCDLPHLPEGAVGKFMLTQMAAVAELEAGLISERTKAALKAASKRGVKLGFAIPSRRKGQRAASEAGVEANQKKADASAEKFRLVIRDIQAGGATTLREIAGQLNDRNITTARNGRWHPSSVSSVLARLKEVA